jgi:hypothetical protein
MPLAGSGTERPLNQTAMLRYRTKMVE